MLLIYIVFSPPHCRISWGTCNFKFSFKGLNGNPRTGDCLVSNSLVSFLPLTQHSWRLKISTMKQNSFLHPCQHFTWGMHQRGSPSLTAFLSLLCSILYCLQHRSKHSHLCNGEGQHSPSRQWNSHSQECIYCTGGGHRQLERAQTKLPESTLMAITTTPAELLQMDVEHQSIVRTNIWLKCLNSENNPSFCVSSHTTLKVSQILLHPFPQGNCSFTSSCHYFPVDNYPESTVIPQSIYRTSEISWVFGGVL